jgi:hypothetical protein
MAVLGAFVGALGAFLLRPSAPFIGQLPLEVCLTRGVNLTGLDQMLVPLAQQSFNVIVAGIVIGAVIGAAGYRAVLAGSVGESRPVMGEVLTASQSTTPAHGATATIEVSAGMTPYEVESRLGRPDRMANVGPKTLYFYPKMKITFTEGKVSDID